MLLVLVLVGLFALFAAIAATPTGQAWLQVLAARWDDIRSAVVGIFT
jgi:hypothetical protein